MAAITYERLKSDIARANSILILILGFAIYKMIKYQVNTEFMLVAIGSFICFVGNSYFSNKATKMLINKLILIKATENLILSFILLPLLGLFPFYLFIYKGLYGIYLLIDSFSWFLLLFRLFIIAVSYSLALS